MGWWAEDISEEVMQEVDVSVVVVVVVVTHKYLLLPLELPTDNNLNVHTARPPDFLSRFHSAANLQNSRPSLHCYLSTK